MARQRKPDNVEDIVHITTPMLREIRDELRIRAIREKLTVYEYLHAIMCEHLGRKDLIDSGPIKSR